ncbi:MAG: M20/M25/M40 family metallo-hydrolase [Novosphingobium sp.]
MLKSPLLVLALALVLAPFAQASARPKAAEADAISSERLSADVRTLASPSFAGRAPGTAGEAKTINWLVGQLKKIGLKPGGPNGAWIQPVPLIRTRLGSGTIAATGKAGSLTLTQMRDIYVSTVRAADRVRIAEAPLVFVGYGINAPERGWDDFKDIDLKGKVAVFLINDPDFEAAAGEPVAGKFGGRRMTYYGRWTYKFEEAARRGAIAALIVHDAPGAGYGWNTVTAPGGENYDIAAAPDSVALQGWLEGAAANRLFAAAGLDLATQRLRARSADFRPVELGMTLAADLPVTHEALMSRNVLARIDGRTRANEVVMFGAHWDAYGQGAADAEGRTVRPGATDDALGVAGLLELARRFKQTPTPDRSVVFAFWTAEERGLLGSETYASKPVYRAADTVANITLDILQTGGPARDVMLVGQGQNSLEDDLATAAAHQGRTVTPEALPERGLFYRADHFPLAKRGVPTLLLMAISGAPDLVAGGRPAGQAWLDGYMHCYHQTCDEWNASLDFSGAAQDVALAYRVGRDLATSARWPQWRKDSEFRQTRAADGR